MATSMVLILIGRALNIFPLARLVNKYRDVKISIKEQFVMWFSGMAVLMGNRRLPLSKFTECLLGDFCPLLVVAL